jgi:tetratricopeptide (TPR) repeat protein
MNAGAASGLVDALADSMLFRNDGVRVPRPQGKGGTSSLRARQIFLRGQAALEEGDFLRADSAFFAATRIDPDDAQALIWLANVRSWMRNWGEHSWGQLTRQAAQAVARRGPVAPSDSVLLMALVALDADRWQDACSQWSSLTDLNPFDFAAWYGLANCLAKDKGVLRDPASTSSWRFRSSYEHALRAYEQAFRLRSSMLRGFGGRSLGDLQDLFFTRGTRYREGFAIAPDTGAFRAVPLWQRDSLAFVPLRAEQALRGPWPDAQALAVQRQRERFHAISQMWRAEAPASVDAAEALAVSLELLGDAAALDTLRLARTLAREPNDRLRIAASEVLVRVKFSLPADTTGLRAARSLADSLLRAHVPSEHAETQLLGSLAGLTGRGLLAARFATAGGVNDRVPSAIAQSGPALLAYAAIGAPCDTLRTLEGAIENSVATLPAEVRSPIRAEWLMRAAVLAFPDCRLRTLSTAAQSRPHRDAQTELLIALGGNAEAIRNGLAAVSRVRTTFRPADIRMEGLLPGAAALASIGDARRAIDWLDPTLRVLRLSASQNLANVVQTGSLVRAMALRAMLAERVGDAATARAWAKAVVILWSGADPFLQPTVHEMERIAR